MPPLNPHHPNRPRKVLLVSPCGTHPPREGNFRRVLNLADQLQQQGHEVHLALLPNDAFSSGDQDTMRRHWGRRLHVLYRFDRWTWGFRLRRKAAQLMARMGLVLPVGAPEPIASIDDFFQDWWAIQLRLLQLVYRFDVVCAEYVFVSRALLHFPKSILKCIDTHDVFSGRNTVLAERTGIESKWLETSVAAERTALQRADVILGIQQEETEKLKTMVSAPVWTVGHLLEPVTARRRPDQQTAPTLLFVGSGNRINAHGITWFIQEVWPLVRSEVEGASLRIAGTVGKLLPLELADAAGVWVLGPVDSLDDEYAGANLVINPVQFGTGLAIKTIEAIGHGRVVVTTSQGARGAVVADRTPLPIVIEDDARKFAATVVTLLLDHRRRQDLEQYAQRFVKAWNQEQANNLRQALSTQTHGPNEAAPV